MAATATTFLVLTFFLSHLTLLYSFPQNHNFCPLFPCDNLHLRINNFPLSTNHTEPGRLFQIDCIAKTIKFGDESQLYESPPPTIEIIDHVPYEKLRNIENCDAFNNFTFPSSSSTSFFKCKSSSKHQDFTQHYYNYTQCDGYTLFYKKQHSYDTNNIPPPPGCSGVQLPVHDKTDSDPFCYVTHKYNHSLHVSDGCSDSEKQDRSKTKVIVASVVPGVLIIIICILGYIIWHRKKWRNLPYFHSKHMSSQLSTSKWHRKGVPVFSYRVLKEATNNFHPSKELGHGGFGTVYHGILQDGRQVAVKRLYENNCKTVEQFVNEIEILKRLRHKNLVVLYGCSSRRSTELLLVYEYVPNGTLADHLHGDRAKSVFLTWHIRMNIAIETATALSYLHACDIIHRDVKPNNILLDNHFCVKVADFGLSRSFPIGATHVSTAPQGTPGYVDPEYNQCYQLTDRSDVYSFGVVLIELLSSMTAVDLTRHRGEINLANLAIVMIQQSAFNELIDPRLGYEKDSVIKRMTTSVAELAFQCLQRDKEMRPSMDDVLNRLKGIQDY